MANVADKIRAYFAELLKDKKALIKVLSIALILLLSLVLKVHNSQADEITVEASSDISESESSELYVDISGAVKRPGVYEVKTGTRLYEVIELAGGLRSDADTDLINQAAFVEDGAKIIIPVAVSSGSIEGNDSEEYRISQINNDISALVNINTADKDRLKTLTGVGDVIAERIIEYRLNSRFQTKEDIMQVKGIGDSIFEKIKDDITV